MFSLWPATAPKAFANTKFPLKLWFRPLSSHSSKNMANRLELVSHSQNIIFTNCLITLLSWRNFIRFFSCITSRTRWNNTKWIPTMPIVFSSSNKIKDWRLVQSLYSPVRDSKSFSQSAIIAHPYSLRNSKFFRFP